MIFILSLLKMKGAINYFSNQPVADSRVLQSTSVKQVWGPDVRLSSQHVMVGELQGEQQLGPRCFSMTSKAWPSKVPPSLVGEIPSNWSSWQQPTGQRAFACWATPSSACLVEEMEGRAGFLSCLCATLLQPWMALGKIDNDVSLLQSVSKVN